MSSVVRWARRHRTRLAAAGALAGGALLLARLAHRQLSLNTETESGRLVERARKQEHYASTESVAGRTLAGLLPALRLSVAAALDTDRVTAILRAKPAQQDRLQFWAELKVIAFSRVLAVVVGGAQLALLLRIQLSVLAGSLYRPGQNLNNNPDKPGLGPAVQAEFLAACQRYVEEGVVTLCEEVAGLVSRTLATLPLHHRLGLAELEEMLSSLLSGCLALPQPRLSLPHSTSQPQLAALLAEVEELLATPDSQIVLGSLCRQGVQHCLDVTAHNYNQRDNATFTSPAQTSLPLAKLLPILSSQVDCGTEDAWLAHLQGCPGLASLGANVYEAFCSCETGETGETGLGQKMLDTVRAWI